MSIVEAEGLYRTFQGRPAVDGTAFAIEAGECYGFLGPNGAGKTTTVRMLHGFLPKTGGRLQVLGMDIAERPDEVKAGIGLVPQDDNLDRDLGVRQNLLVYSRYFNIPRHTAEERAEELLRWLSLWERRDDKIHSLSGGMKRRLALARALVNDPQLLILDEPTTGLDPQARRLIWEMVHRLKKQGKTIILTTHYMDEAERLCDRLAIMHQGRILMEGPPQELIDENLGEEMIEANLKPGEADRLAEAMARAGIKYERSDDTVYLYPPDPDGMMPTVLEYGHIKVVHRRVTLEDLFLHLAGRGLKE